MKQHHHRSAGCRPGALAVAASALIILFSVGLPKGAWAQLVPANLRAAIFLRALGYERGFASGSGAAKLVVVKGASGEAARDGAEMAPSTRSSARAICRAP